MQLNMVDLHTKQVQSMTGPASQGNTLNPVHFRPYMDSQKFLTFSSYGGLTKHINVTSNPIEVFLKSSPSFLRR